MKQRTFIKWGNREIRLETGFHLFHFIFIINITHKKQKQNNTLQTHNLPKKEQVEAKT